MKIGNQLRDNELCLMHVHLPFWDDDVISNQIPILIYLFRPAELRKKLHVDTIEHHESKISRNILLSRRVSQARDTALPFRISVGHYCSPCPSQHLLL